MASGSNNLPEEAGPPNENEASQKPQTKKDNTYLNNKEMVYKTIKNNLWSSSNLEKIFKFKNQTEDDTQNNNKQTAATENSNREISLFNYKIENMSVSGESRKDINNKNVNNNNNNNNNNMTKNCQLFGEEEVTVKLEDLTSKLPIVDSHEERLYDFNENILAHCNYEVSSTIEKSAKREQVAGETSCYNKKRNYLYQDVNEALNSLLWQPYEYQNKSNNANEEYFSLSSFDSYCSLSSFDLEGEPNNELDKLDNSADLHLDVVMMVNNPEGNSNRLNLSGERNKSREMLTGSPPSRLLSNVSRHESVGDGGRCCVVSCDEYKNSYSEMSSHPGCLTTNNIVTTTATGRNPDVSKSTVSVVNLNQSNSDGTNTQQQRRSYVTPSSNPNEAVTKRLCHRSNITSDTSNLNSINVVGLPNHTRHASMPSNSNRNSSLATAAAGKGFLFPNHPRNSSEPSTVIHHQPVVANHARNSSTPAANPIVGSNHVRNVLVPATSNLRNPIQSVSSNVTINQSTPGSSTNISCANIVSILSHHRHSSQDIPNYMPNTLRCASVPKTPSYNIGESGTAVLNITNNHQQQSRVPINVTAVDVNFYRAVPVTVVSNVPTIQCINNVSSERGNSVSNVNIVQAMPQTSTNLIPVANAAPITSDSSLNRIHVQQANSNSSTDVETTPSRQVEAPPRIFISTEAQTDDTLVGTTPVRNNNIGINNNNGNSSERAISREQRRRERRERRHLRRINNGSHQHSGTARDRLPDLLSNHMPPPYSNHLNGISNSSVAPNSGLSPGSVVPNLVVPNGVVPNSVVTNHVVVPYSQGVVPGQLPLVQTAPVAVSVSSPPGCRFPFSTTGFRRSRYSEEHPKSCCGFLAWKPGSLRWFIALIAVVAVCCVLVGTALGAMRPAGRDHLTVSLLMIGVGIVLVTVSGVAWRLTSHDTSTCRAMLGLGSTESVDVCPRRFVPRLPPTYGRPHHPYAAMIYPEFQYRPPPPTYQASMQEYRLRLLLLDRANTPQIQNGIQNGPSPPPTYRSYAGSLLRGPLSNRRDATQSEYSFPPSYRSQTGSTRPTTDLQTSAIIHSREHSLSLSESNHGDSTINCTGYINNGNENINLDNLTIDSLKLTPENDINHVNVLSKGSCSDLNNGHDTNLVTIVQTNDQNPVIVTVSGCSQNDIRNSVQITEVPSEMEILAHL